MAGKVGKRRNVFVIGPVLRLVVDQGAAEQSLARGGVQHQFAERGVKPLVQPTAPAMRNGKRPVDHRVALIILAREARKIESAVEVWFIHGCDETVAADVRRLKPKTGNGTESRDLGCYGALVAADVRRL